jgi:hypothetical protein
VRVRQADGFADATLNGLRHEFLGVIKTQMLTNPKSVEGIYRDGKVELFETPDELDETRVIVTFIPESAVDLAARGIDEPQAVSLRARLRSFAEDWERPDMEAYDAL